jgi:hypothetical protein
VPPSTRFCSAAHGEVETYFIKNYMREPRPRQKFLYVSLYGVSDFDQISDQLFKQLHPILASPGMSAATKILKGVLKTTLNFDLDGNKTNDLSISSQLPDINCPDYLKNIGDEIYIFDDVERCELPIRTLLGYINNIVENENCKAILIANETEVKEKADYSRVKEKVIGRTLELISSYSEAVAYFISQTDDNNAAPSLSKFLTRHNATIEFIYNQLGLNNLKILQQTIWEYERLWKELTLTQRRNVRATRAILRLFLSLSFEFKAGRIASDDLLAAKASILTWRMSNASAPKPPIAVAAERYRETDFGDTVLSDELLVNMLAKGIFDKKAIQESLRRSSYFAKRNAQELWVKANYYYWLTDKQFDEFHLIEEGCFC